MSDLQTPATEERRGSLPTPPYSDDGKSNASKETSPSREVDFTLPHPRPKVDVLDIDKKTPDAHVPRDSRMIRLTGVHPFNSEAPLTELFNEGFLTSPELFYVRNHGAVPEVLDDDIAGWELSIEGYVLFFVHAMLKG